MQREQQAQSKERGKAREASDHFSLASEPYRKRKQKKTSQRGQGPACCWPQRLEALCNRPESLAVTNTSRARKCQVVFCSLSEQKQSLGQSTKTGKYRDKWAQQLPVLGSILSDTCLELLKT